jgi:hypothetical protein
MVKQRARWAERMLAVGAPLTAVYRCRHEMKGRTIQGVVRGANEAYCEARGQTAGYAQFTHRA